MKRILSAEHIIGLPKGDLLEPTLRILRGAGIEFTFEGRRLWAVCNYDDYFHGVLLRPTEIIDYVISGKIGLGFAGWDALSERTAESPAASTKFEILADLRSSRVYLKPVRWVVALPEESDHNQIEDFCRLSKPITVASEIPLVTANWFKSQGINATVERSLGSTEAKAPQFVDAIVDCVHTGETLRRNGLKEVAEICRSTTRMIANAHLLSKRPEFSSRAKLWTDKIVKVIERQIDHTT